MRVPVAINAHDNQWGHDQGGFYGDCPGCGNRLWSVQHRKEDTRCGDCGAPVTLKMTVAVEESKL